jgi:hypothetical protein
MVAASTTPESEPELEPDDPELPPLLPEADEPELDAEEEPVVPELPVEPELDVDPELDDVPELEDPLGAPELEPEVEVDVMAPDDEPLVPAPESEVCPPEEDPEPLPDGAGCAPESASWTRNAAEPEHPHVPIAMAATTDTADRRTSIDVCSRTLRRKPKPRKECSQCPFARLTGVTSCAVAVFGLPDCVPTWAPDEGQ